MRRLSINWEGELIPSPHGDLVEYRDVIELEEEVESLRQRLREAESKDPVVDARVFGWVSPSDARKFLSGHRDSVRVFKMKTPLFRMPLRCEKGPNHYQKPPVGAIVKVEGVLTMSVVAHTDKGLTVRDAFGHTEEVTKWTWKP